MFAGLLCGDMHTVRLHQPGVAARADCPRGSAGVAGACRSALQCRWAPPERGNALMPAHVVWAAHGVIVTLQDP